MSLRDARSIAQPITDALRAWFRRTGGRGEWFELTDMIAAAILADRAAVRDACAVAVDARRIEKSGLRSSSGRVCNCERCDESFSVATVLRALDLRGTHQDELADPSVKSGTL